MNFAKHLEIKGKQSHAFLGASQNAWLRYSDEELVAKFLNQYRTELGTEMHDFASTQIRLGNRVTSMKATIDILKTMIYTHNLVPNTDELSDHGIRILDAVSYLPKEVFETLRDYINDAIGFRMKTEQPLVYSERCFGTADAISFDHDILRIHDLKTGAGKVHIDQLLIYASLFCLEYKIKPGEIQTELRIYQNCEIQEMRPQADDILPIMDRIVFCDKLLRDL